MNRKLICVYDLGSVPPRQIASMAHSNGCDVVFLVPYNPHCDSVLPVLELLGDVVRVDEFSFDHVMDLLRALEPAGILTFSEPQLLLTSRVADALDLAFHTPEVIPGLINKRRQREILAAAGIPGPNHVVVTRVDMDTIPELKLRYPVVVKPMVGSGSRNTARAENDRELQGFLREFLEVEGVLIVEEMLVGRAQAQPWGDTIGIDCVVRGSVIETIFITGKFAYQEPFRESGGYGPALVLDAQEASEVEAVARRAIAALGATCGVVGVELKLTSEGPRVIEVNGRLGAWVDDLAVRAGHNVPSDIAIKAALGVPWQIEQDGPPVGIAFNYMIYAPLWATSIKEVASLAPVREIAGVEQVRLLRLPEESVAWQLGAAGAVASVSGLVSDHQQLASLVVRLQQIDWIRYS